MESQPQYPEFKNNPEHFHSCSSKNEGTVMFGSNLHIFVYALSGPGVVE